MVPVVDPLHVRMVVEMERVVFLVYLMEAGLAAVPTMTVVLVTVSLALAVPVSVTRCAKMETYARLIHATMGRVD